MCLQDMAIERKLAVRYAAYSATAGGWLLPANPIRHTLAVSSYDAQIEVIEGVTNAGRVIALARSAVFNGGGVSGQPVTLVLRAADLGEALCGPLYVSNGTNSATLAPYETYPTADLDKLVERALPQ